jgi:hypothetical protein
MTYKDPQRKKESELKHRTQRLARRRQLRQRQVEFRLTQRKRRQQARMASVFSCL